MRDTVNAGTRFDPLLANREKKTIFYQIAKQVDQIETMATTSTHVLRMFLEKKWRLNRQYIVKQRLFPYDFISLSAFQQSIKLKWKYTETIS